MTEPVSVQRRAALAAQIEKTVASTPVYDIHTHLYDPAFGELLLWGIDDLLVYHYLVAEAFRQFDIPYDRFWAMSKQQQADAIWDALFLKHSPISEACRGVLTTLNRLGLDVKKRDLPALRKWFAKWNVSDYTTHVMDLAGVSRICMTNSPFDDLERPVWEKGFRRDKRFTAALRVDPLVLDWEKTSLRLLAHGERLLARIEDHLVDDGLVHDRLHPFDEPLLLRADPPSPRGGCSWLGEHHRCLHLPDLRHLTPWTVPFPRSWRPRNDRTPTTSDATRSIRHRRRALSHSVRTSCRYPALLRKKKRSARSRRLILSHAPTAAARGAGC